MTADSGMSNHHWAVGEVKRFTSHTAVAVITPAMKTQNATATARRKLCSSITCLSRLAGSCRAM